MNLLLSPRQRLLVFLSPFPLASPEHIAADAIAPLKTENARSLLKSADKFYRNGSNGFIRRLVRRYRPSVRRVLSHIGHLMYSVHKSPVPTPLPGYLRFLLICCGFFKTRHTYVTGLTASPMFPANYPD